MDPLKGRSDRTILKAPGKHLQIITSRVFCLCSSPLPSLLPSLTPPRPWTNIHQWFWLPANTGYQSLLNYIVSKFSQPTSPRSMGSLQAISDLSSQLWLFSHQNTFGCHVFLCSNHNELRRDKRILYLPFPVIFFSKKGRKGREKGCHGKKKILNFGRCFVLCTWVACTAGSLTVSFGTLHTKVTLIRQEEWRGEWHFPSRCCTTVARKCIQNVHTLFKYAPPPPSMRHVSQNACIYECLHTCTQWYIEFCSNPLNWQGALLNTCKALLLILL